MRLKISAGPAALMGSVLFIAAPIGAIALLRAGAAAGRNLGEPKLEIELIAHRDSVRPDLGQLRVHRGGGTSPIRPAIASRARMRSPMGGCVSHSDFARSSKLLIGLTM
jgi:hypothetical protein